MLGIEVRVILSGGDNGHGFCVGHENVFLCQACKSVVRVKLEIS